MQALDPMSMPPIDIPVELAAAAEPVVDDDIDIIVELGMLDIDMSDIEAILLIVIARDQYTEARQAKSVRQECLLK